MYKTKYLNFLKFILILFFVFYPGSSSDAQDDIAQFANLSIVDLMNLEVFSVSKTQEKQFDAPAAIYVITGEDIRRMGVRTITDALRIVPGVEVGHINGSTTAVTIRGFNNRFSSKLLVLIDGKSTYTPFFGGVFWQEIDMILEDIERIEVIRGPGGALWGANAVNGVINIITKSAKDTQGFYVKGGGGNEEQGFVDFRYGSKIGDDLHYRIFGKFFNKDNQKALDGGGAHDEWKSYRAGFRLDWDTNFNNEITIHGDIYRVEAEQEVISRRQGPPLMPPMPPQQPPVFETFISDDNTNGRYIMGKWVRDNHKNSKTILQTYYEYTNRNQANDTMEINQHTYDIDVQHEIFFNRYLNLVWGAGYRLVYIDANGLPDRNGGVRNENRTDHIFSLFIEDKIELIPDTFYLTLGSKFEHNDFTGFEIQPNGRLLWIPHHKHRIWSAVSRAVRTPSRTEDASSIDSSEELLALEAGYRSNPYDWIYIDIAAFYNFYENLSVSELSAAGRRPPPGMPPPNMGMPPPMPPPGMMPGSPFQNNIDGNTYGFEISTTISPTDFWRLQANYSYLEIDLDIEDRRLDNIEEKSPSNQVKLQSFLDLPHNFEVGTSLYWIDELPGPNISDYTRLDIQLAWEPVDHIEVSIVGQNLIDQRHREFFDNIGRLISSKVERSIFGALTFRWTEN